MTRRQREQRAYQLTLATGALAVVAVVGHRARRSSASSARAADPRGDPRGGVVGLLAAPHARRVVPAIWTIGYERLRPESLAAELQAAGVERVIDVRFRPQSRKPGMSKTKLGALLADHRIAYEHRKALGTPPDLRWLFHQGRTQEAAAAYRDTSRPTAPEALAELAAEVRDGPRTALLCLEEDPAGCHRRVITDALRERVEDLDVVDLWPLGPRASATQSSVASSRASTATSWPSMRPSARSCGCGAAAEASAKRSGAR